MNKYKKAVYDIGKILFDREEERFDDDDAFTCCELICRKLYALGLVVLDGKDWEASEKLINYIEESN